MSDSVVRMATAVVFGPGAPSTPGSELSRSSSPRSESTISGDSPRTATTFAFSLRCNSGSSPKDKFDEIFPKIEEIEDEDAITDPDFVLVSSVTEGTDGEPSTTGATAKKRRGRPRKNPPSPPRPVSRPPHPRSKTGCITCRHRKKKCDETKPECNNCQKNGVICEGYSPRDYWRPGRQRRDRQSSLSTTPRDLPPLVPVLETDVDWFFFQHFNTRLSNVLSLFTEQQNPFKAILLPMALGHEGLMHSLLCLSGTHLNMTDPRPALEIRQQHHYSRAIESLRSAVNKKVEKAKDGEDEGRLDDPTVAQTMVLCLNSICAGDIHGEYRPHLDVARHLITSQPSKNADFQAFLVEFFVYHDVSNSITSVDRPSLLQDYHLPQFTVQPEDGMFLGVLDGLFGCLSKVRQLRDKVRERQRASLRPMVDYEVLAEAQRIDSALHAWRCEQQADTPRWSASMLYRQCCWLYLYRTIMLSEPSETLKNAVDVGLDYLRELPTDSSTQSILLMPVFMLGCSAFEESQRPDIRKAFDNLQAYSNLGNIKYASRVVERVWELMDAGDDSSWDWESIFQHFGWDFLVT